MPLIEGPPTTSIAPDDMTGDQLALPTSQRVTTDTRHGSIIGGRVKNGCQVFLNVPYGLNVPRWSDPKPLPEDYEYESKEFTVDGLYCAQPTRSYTLQIPIRDRLGLGLPTENPFFADIYVPSDYTFNTDQELLPVRVFIHGGFLQFGSTSGQHYNQQFFAAEHFNEVRVLLGHRLSVLGFLGSSEPQISGNFGFKDCWLGLEWVRDNISAFGGDPEKVHLSGLSGGGHVVHQLVHQAARLAPRKSPFVTALLQSNAILTDPLSPAARNEQFNEFARALGVDPTTPDILTKLRDTEKYPTTELIRAVQHMGNLSTFRGVIGDDGWVQADQMEYQRSGQLGRDLQVAGVKCIIAGDVRDEDWFYRTVHQCETASDILPNVTRYYPHDIAKALLESYEQLTEKASSAECNLLLGRILADGQVHLPIRLLAKDVAATGLPVVRYTVEQVAERLGTNGYVSHGTDLVIQHLRLSILKHEETKAALAWHAALEDAVSAALEGDGSRFVQHPDDEMLLLSKTGITSWSPDWRWPLLYNAEQAIRG